MTDKHADIRESLAKATQGPWMIVKEGNHFTRIFTTWVHPQIKDHSPVVTEAYSKEGQGIYISPEDAQFIANAPEYVRRLLDEVERLVKDNDFIVKHSENTVQCHHLTIDRLEEENERLQKLVEFNRKYGIHSNAMKEIERLRKALEEIVRVELPLVAIDKKRKILVIARKALEGGKE